MIAVMFPVLQPGFPSLKGGLALVKKLWKIFRCTLVFQNFLNWWKCGFLFWCVDTAPCDNKLIH